MRRIELLSIPVALLIVNEVSKLGFNRAVKEEVWEEKGRRCEICGCTIPTPYGIHHRVPEKALMRIGIKGNNCKANAAVLCNHGADHHELADQKAIRERLFWNGNAFVPLSAMPEETYREYHHHCLPKQKHKRRRR